MRRVAVLLLKKVDNKLKRICERKRVRSLIRTTRWFVKNRSTETNPIMNQLEALEGRHNRHNVIAFMRL
jgi:hypothetical protein